MKIYELDPLVMPLREPMSYGSIERVGIALQQNLRLKSIGATLIALSGSDHLEKCDDMILVDNHEQQIEAVLDDQTTQTKIAHIHRRIALSTETYQKNKSNLQTVVTLHGPAEKIAEKYIEYRDLDIAFTVLSTSQMDLENHGYTIAAKIPNGIDTEIFKPRESFNPEYMVCLGRICPYKNQVEAIAACKATGRKLILAGPIDDQDYFKLEITPRIDGRQVRYLGNINESEIRSILEKTEALLMPVKWDDPYPLVVLEANSMGVPVLGYARGGLLDQIENGQNGFLTENFTDFTESLRYAQSLNKAAIRTRTVEKCDWSVVINDYIKLFNSLQ